MSIDVQAYPGYKGYVSNSPEAVNIRFAPIALSLVWSQKRNSYLIEYKALRYRLRQISRATNFQKKVSGYQETLRRQEQENKSGVYHLLKSRHAIGLTLRFGLYR